MSVTAADTSELPKASTSPPRSFVPTKGQLLGLLGLAVISLLPSLWGDFGFFVGQFAAVYAMIGLSVVIVTGYGGLISVMQYSFAGIGAITTGVAMASWGWPFWLALPLAAVSTVPVAAIVGMISVRLKGLYLAIATLTFANALGETLFRWERVTGGQSGWQLERPTLGPIDFSSDVAFYVLCLAVVLLLVWMTEGLRTSRIGRAMLAVKDNELEAQALGINVYKTKLAAFIISGMVAGIGGAFLASLITILTPTAFQSPYSEATSIVLLSLVVIGGINRSIGAFFGAISLVVTTQVFAGADCFYSFVGIYSACLLIFFLLYRPGGIVEVGQRMGALFRYKPILAVAVISVIVGLNVGGAFFFVNAC